MNAGTFPCPSAANGYLAGHVALLRRSLRQLAGRDLLDADAAMQDSAARVYNAPFVVLSHDATADPVLTYGNRRALELFELSWEELTRMPSRLTAEAPDREGDGMEPDRCRGPRLRPGGNLCALASPLIALHGCTRGRLRGWQRPTM